jgi:hypothetical protein
MTESQSHRRWKEVACGCGERVSEYGLGNGKRLDCYNPNSGIGAEVEFNHGRIAYDVRKLSSAVSKGIIEQPRLFVRQIDLDYARNLARGRGIEVVPATERELSWRELSCDLTFRGKKPKLL